MGATTENGISVVSNSLHLCFSFSFLPTRARARLRCRESESSVCGERQRSTMKSNPPVNGLIAGIIIIPGASRGSAGGRHGERGEEWTMGEEGGGGGCRLLVFPEGYHTRELPNII